MKQFKLRQIALLLCCMPLLGMANKLSESNSRSNENKESLSETNFKDQNFSVWGVRYQVKDVERSVTFYTQLLGFKPEQRAGTAFASVSLRELKLILSGPGSSGSRPLPDGRKQEPGGWNRIVLRVDDLTSLVENMKKAGVRFRNEIESGPGGKQIQVEDPDGNPVELFQPAAGN